MDESFKASEDNAEAAAKARDAARDSMMLQAPLYRVASRGRAPVTLRIRNLSAGGLMADCSEPLESGEDVLMELRGVGEVAGKVAWYHDGRVGIAFDRPIDPRQTRKPITVSKRPTGSTFAPRRPGLKLG